MKLIITFAVVFLAYYAAQGEIINSDPPPIQKSKLKHISIQFNKEDTYGDRCGDLKNLRIRITNKQILKDQIKHSKQLKHCQFSLKGPMPPSSQKAKLAARNFKLYNEEIGIRGTLKCDSDRGFEFDNKDNLPYFEIIGASDFCLHSIQLTTESGEVFTEVMNRITQRRTTRGYLPILHQTQYNAFENAMNSMDCPREGHYCKRSDLIYTSKRNNTEGYYCDLNPRCGGVSSSNPEDEGNGLMCEKMELGSMEVWNYCCAKNNQNSGIPYCGGQ